MYLISLRPQEIAFPTLSATIYLQEHEKILTEISRKYTKSSIHRLLSKSGLIEHAHFEPDNEYFSLVLNNIELSIFFDKTVKTLNKRHFI